MSTADGAAAGYTVLVPAFQPDGGLPALVRAVADTLLCTVVVVDDGSPADSARHFRELEGLARVVVLRHDRNRGKGEAVKTGLRHLLGRGGGGVGVVTMDADGQHTLEDVRAVGARLLRERDALILGERSLRGAVPALSRAGNALTRVVFNRATGMRLRDTQSGLRGIPLSLAPALLQLRSSRYEFELDMLFLCRERGIPVAGVDIRTVYFDNNRASHFRPLRDSARVGWRLLAHVALAGRARTRRGAAG